MNMPRRVKLSVGDCWEYEKGFHGTKGRLSSRFGVVAKRKIKGVECFAIEWDERSPGGRRLVWGRYWVDSKTERFMRAERAFFDARGRMLHTEIFGLSELRNWGIKGHARVTGPLEVGETWGWKDRGSRSEVSVIRRERIKVPAGNFECFLVETKVYENGLKFSFNSWYSVELGIIVRSTSHDREGKETGFTELVKYLIGGRSAKRSL